MVCRDCGAYLPRGAKRCPECGCDYFLPHFREVFHYYFLKYFLMVFLFVFFFWNPYDSNVVVIFSQFYSCSSLFSIPPSSSTCFWTPEHQN